MAPRAEPPASRRAPEPEPEPEALIDSAAADIDDGEAASTGDLETAWERVVGEVLKRKALLGSVLQHASPLRVEQGVLTLALQASGFHREMLNDRGNKELINEAVQRHVASARRFELDTNAATPAGGGGARNHPAVQAALSTFQGEVVAVRPRSPEEGESR
jgi:phytoene/squalene synthetase